MKKLRGFMAGVIALVFLLAVPATYAREKSLMVTAGGIGGSWFIAGAAFNEVWEKSISDLKTSLVPGGGNSNPIRVNKGEADVGFTYSTNAIAAMRGVEPYKESLNNIRGLGNLQMKQYLVIAALRSTGLTSFEDVVKIKFPLKICPGTRGLGGELTFRQAMAEYGISYQDIQKWGGKIYFASWNESVSQIQDGHANALTSQTVLANPFMVELCTSRDMKFLALTSEVSDRMVEKHGFTKEIMPKDSYKGMDSEYLTVADSVILLCKKDLSDEMAYLLAKFLSENQKKWVDTHVMFKDFVPQGVAKLPAQIPIHPGAAKYFKEKGYMK
jgi:hypothetical protein